MSAGDADRPGIPTGQSLLSQVGALFAGQANQIINPKTLLPSMLRPGSAGQSLVTNASGVAEWAGAGGYADLSMNAGFSAYGAGFGQPQYSVMPDGLVVMRGLVTGSAGRASNVIGTLPVGYRPGDASRVFAIACSVGGADANTHLYVNTDGTVALADSLTPLASAATWASLNVSFYP